MAEEVMRFKAGRRELMKYAKATITVEVTNTRLERIATWAGLLLIKAGASLIGVSVQIDLNGK